MRTRLKGGAQRIENAVTSLSALDNGRHDLAVILRLAKHTGGA